MLKIAIKWEVNDKSVAILRLLLYALRKGGHEIWMLKNLVRLLLQ